MRIVVKDRRFNSDGKRYTLGIDIDYKSIPDNLQLTTKVIEQYNATKSPLGYATFRDLKRDDIITILSAVKRQEATVNVERMGYCAYYKLHNGK